jgi:cytoskeletal protein CcmA (bactofilin family)
VLRGLFGKKQSILPPPPKNQIEVVCPACGAAQYEPRLVVSTFCKSCGVHLTVHKKKVTASTVTRSGAVGLDDLWENPRPAPAAPSTPAKPQSSTHPSPPATDDPAPDLPALAPPPAPDPEAAAQTGFGAFLQAASLQSPPPPASPLPTASSSLPLLKASVENASPAPARPPSTPAAPPNSTLEKMKSQSVYRQQYFKEVECFECGHKLKVNRSSKLSDCPQCAAIICLEDLDINTLHTAPIRTRGDVIVRKPGRISTSRVECRDLRCLGQIEAEIDCQGEATFRNEGTIKGPVTCLKLVVEKGARVAFTHTVKAGDMFINSHVTGHLSASGKITIGLYGSVDGDVTARSVTIEPGGELNGAMNIVRPPAPASPPPPPPPPEPETSPAAESETPEAP